jgi:uncharacterized membrane protein (UPF0127 family)
MKKTIYFKNKKIILENIIECKGLKKGIGLMFKNRSNAKILFFSFNKPVKISIHSFFCPNFLVVWLDSKDNVVDYKFVSKTEVINPNKEFFGFVEIPLNKKYKKIFKAFLGKEKDLNTLLNIKSK